MADRLCAPEDLASLLEKDLDAYKAIMLIECGTAVVQTAAGDQRIVLVTDDTFEVMGTSDSFLQLPQRPVSAVADVTIDGDAVTAGTAWGNYKRFGSRLYRACGWASCWSQPSTIAGTYTHGYDVSAPDPSDWPQDVQLARGAVLGLIRGLFDNPTGVSREAIDDYQVAYETMSAAMDANPNLQAALRRRYGQSAGLVRIG